MSVTNNSSWKSINLIYTCPTNNYYKKVLIQKNSSKSQTGNALESILLNFCWLVCQLEGKAKSTTSYHAEYDKTEKKKLFSGCLFQK